MLDDQKHISGIVKDFLDIMAKCSGLDMEIVEF